MLDRAEDKAHGDHPRPVMALRCGVPEPSGHLGVLGWTHKLSLARAGERPAPRGPRWPRPPCPRTGVRTGFRSLRAAGGTRSGQFGERSLHGVDSGVPHRSEAGLKQGLGGCTCARPPPPPPARPHTHSGLLTGLVWPSGHEATLPVLSLQHPAVSSVPKVGLALEAGSFWGPVPRPPPGPLPSGHPLRHRSPCSVLPPPTSAVGASSC